MEQDRDADSQRGHLSHRNVDEDDAALHDMEAEINEQPRQEHTGHDGPKHYFPHIFRDVNGDR
jgi:hypothetical protein